MKLIKKSWLASKGIQAGNAPIFELVILLEIIFGIGVGFVSSLLEKNEFIFLVIGISYIFTGYQLPLFTKMVNSTPKIYRTSFRYFKRYLIELIFRINELIVAAISTFLAIFFFDITQPWRSLFFLVIIFSMWLWLFLDNSKSTIFFKIGSILIFLSSSFLNFFYFNSLIALISEIVFFIISVGMIRFSLERVSNEFNYNKNILTFRHPELSFFIGIFRANISINTVYLIILVIYVYLTYKFDLMFAIMPFFSALILLEIIAYYHVVMHNQNYQPGRALFMKKSSNPFKKIIYSNISTKTIPVLCISFFVGVYLFFEGKTHLLQIIAVFVLNLFLIWYSADLETKAIVSKTTRPNSIEEHIALMAIIGTTFL